MRNQQTGNIDLQSFQNFANLFIVYNAWKLELI